MRKNMKGFISMLVTMVLVLAALPMTVAASDYEGHWAKDSIDRLVQKGVITLENGNARPGENVTRCEVVAMIVDGLAIKAEGEASFSDIEDDDYAAQILTAVNAGITKGYEDGTFRPENAVSREEVATFFARAMKLADNVEAANAFSDAAAISDWAKGTVGATVTAKLIGGYPDGTFGPKANMTRAEAMKIIDFALGGAPAEVVKGESVTLASGETYGEDGKITEVAYLVVDGPGVTVKNVVVNGDLTLTKNVGKGEVSLLGVDVKGKTLVLGGGPNSVVIENTDLVESHHTELVVLVANVTIKLESGEIETISIEMQAKVTVGKDGVVTALIVNTSAPVTLSGEIVGVTIESPLSNVTLTEGKIGELTVGKDALGSKIGIAKGAEILKAIADAASVFFGQGAIGSLEANSAGVTSEQTPGESKGTHMVETFVNSENKDTNNNAGNPDESDAQGSTGGTPSGPANPNDGDTEADKITAFDGAKSGSGANFIIAANGTPTLNSATVTLTSVKIAGGADIKGSCSISNSNGALTLPVKNLVEAGATDTIEVKLTVTANGGTSTVRTYTVAAADSTANASIVALRDDATAIPNGSGYAVTLKKTGAGSITAVDVDNSPTGLTCSLGGAGATKDTTSAPDLDSTGKISAVVLSIGGGKLQVGGTASDDTANDSPADVTFTAPILTSGGYTYTMAGNVVVEVTPAAN